MFFELKEESKVIKKDFVNLREETCFVKSDFDEGFVPLIPEVAMAQEGELDSQAAIDDAINEMLGGNKKKEEEPKIQKIPEDSKLKEQEMLDSIRTVEYKRGFEEGKQIALKEFEEKIRENVSSIVKRLTDIIESFKSEAESNKKNLDQMILKLAISIAEKVLKREVKLDENIVINQVTESIRKIIGVDSIIIHINPEDENTIKRFKPDLFNMFEGLKEITIQGNDRIDLGSCKIESSLGNVDARFSTQMEIIGNVLLEELTESNKSENVASE